MNNGIYPTKGQRGTTIEKPFTDDVPSNWLVNASDILGQEKGILKLRARNDSIRAELSEWANEAKTKLTTHKHGDRVYYCMHELGITVNLVNS